MLGDKLWLPHITEVLSAGLQPLQSHLIMPAQVWSKDSVDHSRLYGGASTRGLASCLYS